MGDATMLSCLRIRNLAIIDELEIELGAGLNVVTGETGAGKSILIEALELVLGARARPELVRTGAAQAEIEALFSLAKVDASVLLSRLGESGIEAGSELCVRRVVTAQGRSRAYVNGTLVTAAQLQALSAGLVDISSQHEHHSLSEPSAVLAYLDAFAASGADAAGGLPGAHTALVRAMRDAFAALVEADAALVDSRARERGRAEREDLLRFQLAELAELDPKAGEALDLGCERERLRHAEKLLSASAAAEEALYGRDRSITEELAQVSARLALAGALDPALGALSDAVAGARAQLEDAARELGSYSRGVCLDPERLSIVEERVHAITRLGRKHGAALDADVAGALAAKRDAAARELGELGASEARAIELEGARDRAAASAVDAARSLSASRSRAARTLGQAIEQELRALGMNDACVSVALSAVDVRSGLSTSSLAGSTSSLAGSTSSLAGSTSSLAGSTSSLASGAARVTAAGCDAAELLIATNAGEAALPLRSIASGGELSRTLLAVKRVLALRISGRLDATRSAAGLFVFDEVDAGVGGAIGEVVGRSLSDIAQHHAVLCVTHLAPIAAYATRHFVVSKSVSDGRTTSRVVLLGERERVEELARMLGGLSITKKTRSVASELLRGARNAAVPRQAHA